MKEKKYKCLFCSWELPPCNDLYTEDEVYPLEANDLASAKEFVCKSCFSGISPWKREKVKQ